MTSSRPMTIAFDAKRALLNFTGLGNYSRYAIEAMADAFPHNRYLLFAPKLREDPRLQSLLSRPNIEVVTPQGRFSRLTKATWRHFGGLTAQLRKSGADIYHGLSNELPFDIRSAGIPSVVTIHDLIFRTVPQNYKPIDRRLYDWKFRSAAHRATRVIAISQRTKEDIIRFYGTDPENIDVIYQGCAALFSRPVSADTLREVRQRYSLPERYFISVGTLEQRKNQLLAIESLPTLPADVHLVLVGHQRNGYGDILARRSSQLGVAHRVISLQGVPTEHLPALYSMALFAAYPSRYEGFGLPVIESLSCGTPVIAATGSCLEEAGGGGALYVSPDSPQQFAAEAGQLIADSSLRESLTLKGAEHIRKFNRETFAHQVMATYQAAIDQYTR